MYKFNVPDWIKLDNAATIYPSTLSKKYASMFRMTITLKESIDKYYLEKALYNIMKRFPTFSYKLKEGLFWCYFKHIDGIPPIEEDYKNPMLRINFRKNKHFMFRVRYFNKRIAIEYFHALTDGTGGITFLLTLTAEYLRLKNTIKAEYNNLILNPKDKPKKDEIKDSFYKYSRGIGGLVKEKAAYHIKGTMEANHILNVITGIVPIDKLKRVAHNYNATLTEFLVSLMILSLQDINNNQRKKSTKPIKISVPINLRKYYPTNTLRNFSSYINVGIEPKYGNYSLEEIIDEVKTQIHYLSREKRINAKISGNTNLSKNYFIRLIPMFIKKHIMSLIERLMGDRYCSSTFSNLGLINLPKDMESYVKELGFMIGRSRVKPGSCACLGYNNNLYISFTRKIKETDLERLFFTKLVEFDVPVEIESNEG